MKTRHVVILWALWALVVFGFQMVAHDRIGLQSPDIALGWTSQWTGGATEDQNQPPYLQGALVNNQRAWDSEYYTSIALNGYGDPAIGGPFVDGVMISKNYAFLPGYPLLVAAVSMPLRLFVEPLVAVQISLVTVSLIGALFAMLGLFKLLEKIDIERAWRGVFYFAIFPSAFFLAQAYTEGLFIGLAFMCLAMLQRKKFVIAVILAAYATITRAVGIALVLPLLWAVIQGLVEAKPNIGEFVKKHLYRFGLALLPLIVFAVWKFSVLGTNFTLVEDNFFGRKTLDIAGSFTTWFENFGQIFGPNRQASVYYALELVASIIGVLACLFTLKKYPGLSLFGLAAIAIPFFSAAPQGMVRYVLCVPSIFIVLSQFGKNTIFDRVWTMASVLLFGLLATIFTFNLWVG